MIKFNEGYNTEETKKELSGLLLGLPSSINELIAMEVGENVSTKPSSFDFVLTADFADVEGLDAYRVHPQHMKVLDYLKVVMAKAHVVDYYI